MLTTTGYKRRILVAGILNKSLLLLASAWALLCYLLRQPISLTLALIADFLFAVSLILHYANRHIASRILRLLRKFRDSQKDFKGTFRSAQQDEDPQAATRVAHTLKGVSGTLGAVGVQKAAQKLEMACREGRSGKATTGELGLSGMIKSQFCRLKFQIATIILQITSSIFQRFLKIITTHQVLPGCRPPRCRGDHRNVCGTGRWYWPVGLFFSTYLKSNDGCFAPMVSEAARKLDCSIII